MTVHCKTKKKLNSTNYYGDIYIDITWMHDVYLIMYSELCKSCIPKRVWQTLQATKLLPMQMHMHMHHWKQNLY